MKRGDRCDWMRLNQQLLSEWRVVKASKQPSSAINFDFDLLELQWSNWKALKRYDGFTKSRISKEEE